MMVMTRKPTQTEESSQKVEESTQPAAQNKEKKATGRPSKYTPELSREICERLSEGEPLRQICRDAHMPAWRTVYDWMGKSEDLAAAIARARDIGYDKMAEECLEIADNMQMGLKETVHVDAKGNESVSRANEDMLGHRRLQIETRLKLLAKFHPHQVRRQGREGGGGGPDRGGEGSPSDPERSLEECRAEAQKCGRVTQSLTSC